MNLQYKYFRGFANVVNLNLRTVEVVAGERRIRAQWSPEMVQEIDAYHNIDAEAELTTLLSQEIAREIDQQIVNDLVGGNILPMVRRIVSHTIGPDLVTVQPMGGPSGMIFYMGYNNKTSLLFNFKYLK